MPACQTSQYTWEVATNLDEVNALLQACDTYVSRPGSPIPKRNPETTAKRIADKQVHLLRKNQEPIAMFTLGPTPTFNLPEIIVPYAANPIYISRLAVSPALQKEGSIIGAQCLKHAINIAKIYNADAIRSEANPALSKVIELLRLFGFEDFFAHTEELVSRVYFQKKLGNN